jgi:tripartite-type tricarboxylate transporter receptor subunit TctC
MLHRRRFLTLAGSTLAAPYVLTGAARAADWPTKPVRMIVPFTPAGGTDVMARIMCQRLSEMWGQQVIVENKPGAGANIGTDIVAKADPDGYTFMINSVPLAVNKFLYASLPYDPLNDIAPVVLLVMQPNIMAVPNSSPATSVAEFIAHAKANAGKITYASSGNGTSLHLSGEMFKRMAGVEMTHVPYRGAAPAINDLIPGRVDVIFDNVSSILPHVQGKTVRGLACTTAKRITAAPELPPIGDTVKGFDVSSWFAFFTTAKAPPEIIAKMNKDCVEALQHPSVKARVQELGAEIVGSSPEALGSFVRSEMDKWGPVIREAKIRID